MAGPEQALGPERTEWPGAKSIIALDVGGTAIKSGIVDPETCKILDRRTTPLHSNAPASDVLSVIAAAVRRHEGHLSDRMPDGLGLAFPSPFDYKKGVCMIEPGPQAKFEHLYHINVRDELAERLGMPPAQVRFMNDAEAAVCGEARFGAGAKCERLIGLTLGTGLGSCFVNKGRVAKRGKGIPKGEAMLYGEPFEDGIADEYFSVRGLMARFPVRDGPSTDVKTASRLARGKDPEMRRAFRGFGTDLGRFLEPYTSKFGAEIVLVMGGLANCLDLFADQVKQEIGIPCLHGQHPGSDAALLSVSTLFHQLDPKRIVIGA